MVIIIILTNLVPLLFLITTYANVLVSTLNTTGTRAAEFCEGQTFKADCLLKEDGRSGVVVMVSAKYGRMRPSRCLRTGSSTNINCEINVLGQFDLWCSGRRSCEVRVSSIIDYVPYQMPTCLNDFRGYLEASFICVPVISRRQNECTGHHALVQLSEPAGYIGNVVTAESGCGSIEVPWVLEAPRGQTIHLRLMDFASAGQDKTSSQKNCQVYAVIKEKSISTGHTICSSDQRELNVYVSETNNIEVRIVAAITPRPPSSSDTNKDVSMLKRSSNLGYFLLKYTLHGCADIPAGNGRWVERIGSVSVVGCNGTAEKYQLICEQNSWIGELKDCSYWGVSSTSSVFGSFWTAFTESQWIAVATILGIALIIGVVIFLAGIICIKRRRQIQSYGTGVCSSPRCMAEYHLARCANDPAIMSRNGSATPKSLSLDLIGGGSIDGSNVENDYFRTWQLQRNAFNNMRCTTVPNSPTTNSQSPHSHINASNTTYPSTFKPLLSGRAEQEYNGEDFQHFRKFNQPQPLVEHIYESPKFDRKEYDIDCYGGSNVAGVSHTPAGSQPLTSVDNNATVHIPARTDEVLQPHCSRT